MSSAAGPDRAAAARLAAEVRREIAALDRSVGILSDALARHRGNVDDVVIVHGVAGLVHDFYTGVERIFERISPSLDGATPTGGSWHRDLLRAMSLDLPTIRPPVLSVETEAQLAEYLRFRHLFRNLYAFDLKWSRVRELAEGVAPLWATTRDELSTFLSFLDAIVASI